MQGLYFGIKSFATSTGVVNTETARMRAEANTTSNIVALVSQDEKVEILEKSGDWYKVKYKDNTGYIYAQYVDNKDNKSEQSTNNTTAPNNTVSNTTINNETENNINNKVMTIKGNILDIDVHGDYYLMDHKNRKFKVVYDGRLTNIYSPYKLDKKVETNGVTLVNWNV